MALEVALAVRSELQSRLEAADRLRRLDVERAQHEAALARRRYMQVDPENRLVADSLESEWNTRLRDLREAMDEYERRRAADLRLLSEEQARAIRDLAGDLPRLWKDPAVPHQERKRMVRLLVEDVTLVKADRVTMHVRFLYEDPGPQPTGRQGLTHPEVIRAVEELLEEHTEHEVARVLDERGLISEDDPEALVQGGLLLKELESSSTSSGASGRSATSRAS